MSVEVEIKLKINSRTDIERVLEETGFVRADLVLESDTYYTSDHHDFAALDEAFRVRSTENRMTGKRSAAITYKGAKMDRFSTGTSGRKAETAFSQGEYHSVR